jgi:hypothetical protein
MRRIHLGGVGRIEGHDLERLWLGSGDFHSWRADRHSGNGNPHHIRALRQQALEGVPRALFMLFGGAVTDRFSPRVIMLVADIARLVLAALMAVAVLTGVLLPGELSYAGFYI